MHLKAELRLLTPYIDKFVPQASSPNRHPAAMAFSAQQCFRNSSRDKGVSSLPGKALFSGIAPVIDVPAWPQAPPAQAMGPQQHRDDSRS